MIYYWKSGRVQCPVGICKGCKCEWHDADISKKDMIKMCRKINVPIRPESMSGDPGQDVNRMWYDASLLHKDKKLKKLVIDTIPSSSESDSDESSSDSDESSSSGRALSGGSSDSSSLSASGASDDLESPSETEEQPPLAKRQRKDKGQQRGSYTPTAVMQALRGACAEQGLATKGSATQLRERLIASVRRSSVAPLPVAPAVALPAVAHPPVAPAVTPASGLYTQSEATLRASLKTLGLAIDGDKDALVHRLSVACNRAL